MAKAYEIRIKVTGEGAPQVKMIKRDLEAVKRTATGVDRKFAAANVQTKKLAGNMRQASTSAKGMGLNIKKAMGYFGIAAGGYMVVGQLKDASRAAMQLETDLANVNSLLGKSHPMYNQYREDILKLKRVVPVLEIQDLTAGLYEGISAGHDAGQVIEYLTATSKAAAGGWTDVSTVIKGTNKVMAAYGIETKDAMKATDIGLKTVEKANLNYAEYAENIGMCVGTAKMAKVSIEELHGAIAAASMIQRPEQVFTGLRTAILDLPKKRAELKDLGIEYTTLGDTIRQLKERQLTEEDWLKLGLEARAGETIKAITLKYDTFTDTVRELGDASGATIDKFNERMGTSEAKMKSAKTVIDEYKTAIGVELNEALITAIAGQEAFNKAAGEPIDTSGIEKFGDALKDVAKAAGWVEKTVGKLSKWQWEMMGWDPLGVMGKGPSFGAFGKTEGVISYPGSRPAASAARPRAAAAGNTYNTTTIHNLTVKSDKVDKDSLVNTVRKVVEEEAPTSMGRVKALYD